MSRTLRSLVAGASISLSLWMGLLGTASALAADLIKPGDRVDGIAFKAVDVSPESLRIGDYCDEGSTEVQSGAEGSVITLTKDCNVPLLQDWVLGLGWVAKDAETLESNWDALTWEMYLDGRPFDLPAFGTSDYDRVDATSEGETSVRVRTWRVAADISASGVHTIRVVLRVSEDVFDGFETTSAGTYQYDYNLVIGDAAQIGMPTAGNGEEQLAAWGLTSGFGLIAVGLLCLTLNALPRLSRKSRL